MIQAEISSDRQYVERPMRMGRGTNPSASHVRQPRTDFPNMAATWSVVSSSGGRSDVADRPSGELIRELSPACDTA